MLPPPRDNLDISIIHKVKDFYKDFYRLGDKISKRDKFSIYLKTELIIIELLHNLIDTAFKQREYKKSILENQRVNVEILKQLIRLMNELDIIESNPYIYLESKLQEISKMITGWIKYLTT